MSFQVLCAPAFLLHISNGVISWGTKEEKTNFNLQSVIAFFPSCAIVN